MVLSAGYCRTVTGFDDELLDSSMREGDQAPGAKGGLVPKATSGGSSSASSRQVVSSTAIGSASSA